MFNQEINLNQEEIYPDKTANNPAVIRDEAQNVHSAVGIQTQRRIPPCEWCPTK